MRAISALRRTTSAVLHSEELLGEIREGVAKLSRTEQTLTEIREGIAHLARTEQLLLEIREGISNQTLVLKDKLTKIIELFELQNGIGNVPSARK
jgi:methyl-accepting chemotaxis protein